MAITVGTKYTSNPLKPFKKDWQTEIRRAVVGVVAVAHSKLANYLRFIKSATCRSLPRDHMGGFEAALNIRLAIVAPRGDKGSHLVCIVAVCTFFLWIIQCA